MAQNEEETEFLPNKQSSSHNPKSSDHIVEDDKKRKGKPPKLELDPKQVKIPLADWAFYKFGMLITAYPAMRFLLLLAISACATVVLGNMWARVVDPDGDNGETKEPYTAMYTAFQVLLTGGFDLSMHRAEERIVFFLMIITGLSIVSILIGLIADAVSSGMDAITDNSVMVVEKNHTLILGWNEGTPRVITQIACLRKIHKMQKRSCAERCVPFWPKRVKPESPVACGTIVVMNDDLEVDEMRDAVAEAFSVAGLDDFRSGTKIGSDVVFRKGSPCASYDLLRVSAQQASSICVMMTEADTAELACEEEAGAQDDAVDSSATMRCLLALRSTLASSLPPNQRFMKRSLRVVVQAPSTSFQLLRGINFRANDGHDCFFPQDLKVFTSSLFFSCASRPLLSHVYSQLLDANGPSAIHCRLARELRAGPSYQKAWFVGKPMREGVLEHCWGDGLVIGVAGSGVNLAASDEAFKSGGKGLPGLVSDPERLIESDDYIIFLGATSIPERERKLKGRIGAEELSALRKESEQCLQTSRPIPRRRLSSGFFGASDEKSGLRQDEDEKTATSNDKKSHVAAASFESPESVSESRKPMHVVLCGWLPEWDSDPGLFIGRCKQLSPSTKGGLPPGSTLTTANTKTAAEMASLLSPFPQLAIPFSRGANGTRGPLWAKRHGGGWAPPPVVSDESRNADDERGSPDGWVFGGGLELWHHCADPTSLSAMEPLFDSSLSKGQRQITTAICLGSATGKELTPSGSDSRVLRTMLVIRILADKMGVLGDVHVVAENKQVQNSELGLGICDGMVSDFINTNSIVASALAMNLAFPQSWDALSGLVSTGEGTPDVVFFHPQELGIALSSKSHELRFGTIQHVLSSLLDGECVAIGYLAKAEVVLGPSQSQIVSWTAEHRIIAISRSA